MSNAPGIPRDLALSTKRKDYPTLFINLFGGPSSGKSTTAAGSFALAKLLGLKAELITEYAKDVTWSEAQAVLRNQLYVFGKQYNRMFRLNGKVEVAITDSPILLSLIYDAEEDPALADLVLARYHSMRNLNIFIKRVKPYNPEGRNQTEEQSDEISRKTIAMLDHYAIPYQTMNGDAAAIGVIAQQAYKHFRRGYVEAGVYARVLEGRIEEKRDESRGSLV